MPFPVNGEWGGVRRNVIDRPLTFSYNSEARNIDEYDIGSNLMQATVQPFRPHRFAGEAVAGARGPTSWHRRRVA